MITLTEIGICILVLVLTVLLYELIRIPGVKKQSEKLGLLTETSKRHEVAKEVVSEFKNSSEMEAAKALEYQKGLAEGEQRALSKFEIRMTPMSRIKEDLFSLKVESGYQMQIHFNGFPIGDPTIRITHSEQKVDKKEIEKYVDKVVTFVKDLGLSFQNQGLKTQVLEATRQKVKKF